MILGKTCRFGCSYTSRSPMYNPSNIDEVSVKNAQCPMIFHSDSTNITQSVNQRPGGEGALNTACSTYRSCCDLSKLKYLIGATVFEGGTGQKQQFQVWFSFLMELQQFASGSNPTHEPFEPLGIVANSHSGRC